VQKRRTAIPHAAAARTPAPVTKRATLTMAHPSALGELPARFRQTKAPPGVNDHQRRPDDQSLRRLQASERRRSQQYAR
jgi:hypothetical protein